MDIMIERGAGRLVLMPGLGGSVRSFTWNEQDILFPAAAGSPSSPLETAAFPLFPFSGRINEGRFDWHGRRIQLDPNFEPEPHAIHGQAWLAPWSVDAITTDAAQLSYRHTPGKWPWAYRAVQRFALVEDGLNLDLELENLSAENMPAGLGWHPYFPRRSDAKLTANVSGIWDAREGMIPEELSPLGPENDLNTPRRVNDLRLDNAFAAHAANADIAWPSAGLQVSIQSSDILSHLVVYVPENQAYFCVEPVSHAPDAVNSVYGPYVTGLKVISPGDTLHARISLKISEKRRQPA